MRLLGEIRESLGVAVRALVANRGRGALTTLGIVIGIVAVVTTMTAANGLQNRFRESFSSIGADVVYVSRMPWVIMNDFFRYRNRPRLDLHEARALEERLRGRAIVNPTLNGRCALKFRSETLEDVTLVGTTERQELMSSARPETGRFLASYDVAFHRDVCVIGRGIRDGLFRGTDPVGKTLHVDRVAYRVIGVMEKQGGSFLGGPDFDRQVIVPITSFARQYGGRRGHVDVNLAVKAPRPDAAADLEYLVKGEMRKVRRLRPATPDDFSINKLDTLIGTFDNVMGVVLLVGLLVTGVSLFVGAIGVMNILLVSVTERTREIGIRKAIGATRRSILLQFLFESCAICVLGGAVGGVLSAGVAAAINATVMPARLSPGILLVAFVISLAVGVAAGVAPAFRGARLDPIAALRHE